MSNNTVPRKNTGDTLSAAELNDIASSANSKQDALGFTPENVANKNIPNGYAGLDSSGKLLSSQWPAGIDEVIEYANLASFPVTGNSNIIYITQDTNAQYRWSGSAYIEIVASPGTTDSVTEGTTNKYFTTARVLSTLLTGIGFITSTAVIATDSIITALGKLQAQITALFKIPAGGSTGQVLAKTSNTDGDVGWVNVFDTNIPINDTSISLDSVWSSSKVNDVITDDITTNLLDGLTNIAAAFGIVRLNSTATKAIRLRRTSDNIETDFYFAASGKLVVEDIIDFLVGNRGYISKWYDQSGAGNDAVQATVAYQPYLAIDDEKVCVRYEYTGDNNVGFALPYTLSVAIDVQNTTIFSAYSSYLNAGILGIGLPITKRYFFTSQNAQMDLGINSSGTLINGLELKSNGTVKVSNMFTAASANYWTIRSNSTGIRLDSNYKTANLTATASYDETSFQIGNTFVPGNGGFYGDIYCLVHFNNAQTDTNIATLVSRSETQFELINPANSSINLVLEGDSITMGAHATDNKNYVSQLNAINKQSLTNFAVSASYFGDLINRAASLDYSKVEEKTNVLIVWCGTNDISNYDEDPTTVYNNYVSYVTARKAAGWNKVYVITMLPRTQTWETQRNAFNSLLLTDTTHFDGIIDIGSDPRFAIQHTQWPVSLVDIYSYDTAYIYDGIHPNTAGYSVCGSYIDPIIEQLLTNVVLTNTIGKRLTDLENKLSAISGRVILNTTAKQLPDINVQKPVYFSTIYGDSQIFTGTIIIAGSNPNTIVNGISSTIIEPSGKGHFTVGQATTGYNRFLFAAQQNFGPGNTFICILSPVGSSGGVGYIISNVDDGSANTMLAGFYIGSDNIVYLRAPELPMNIWTIDNTLTITGYGFLNNHTHSIFNGNLTMQTGAVILNSTSHPISAASGVSSTNKIRIQVDGTFYYLLATNS